MFILLATTAAEGSRLKLVVAIIIAIAVAAGAGLRVFTVLTNKKIASGKLDGIVNLFFKDEELHAILKSVITDECFQNSNTYEDFIHNVHAGAKELVYNYIQKNMSLIPAFLHPFVTMDNMEYIASNLLGAIGLDGKELTDKFEKYLEDLLTEEIVDDKDDESAGDVMEEIDELPEIKEDEVESAPAAVEVDDTDVTAEIITDAPTEEVAVTEGETIEADVIEGETPTLEVDETADIASETADTATVSYVESDYVAVQNDEETEGASVETTVTPSDEKKVIIGYDVTADESTDSVATTMVSIDTEGNTVVDGEAVPETAKE